ncbi:hypothetical protein R1T16_14625 [Flavobacterium sp. DG1-102-2]|uniref:hypothetical protein n=1 Tax=Flavobacterium sp. DG1-102-2 TaxID=3081663 RepID=UPI00294A3BE0|nr:hypothetical protein [Flavobacterium sp. DG1-102-2]MDV6169669.1 hypothetical protein [Flavobacterium sp. DG1-102-2]
MAYSEIELSSLDLDIFFSDNRKLIHLASGGGTLPNNLISTDIYNEDVLELISKFNPEFEIEINPNLSEILNLDKTGLENYLESFIDMAKKGLYTYDKSNLGNFNDTTFHLVAKPKKNPGLSILKEKYQMYNDFQITYTEIPETFEKFDLNEFM